MSHQLLLSPRDGMFIKDGRGWYTSDIGRSRSWSWPAPPTVRGALRASYGHAWMSRTGEPLRPRDWQALTNELSLDGTIAMRAPIDCVPTVEHRLWPVPADALYYESRGAHVSVARLEPRPTRDLSVSWLDSVSLSSLWRAYPHLDAPDSRKPAKKPLFWTDSVMNRWLRGDRFEGESGIDPARREDIHVAINPETGTATDSMMFSTEITESLTRDGGFWQWSLATRFSLPDADDVVTSDGFPGGPITLGGGRRLAPASTPSSDLFAAPADVGRECSGLRVILATPARFERGWLPDGFSLDGSHFVGNLPGIDGQLILRAALLGRPLNLSTWDTVARRPRPTWRLVRAGAVYFFQKCNKAPFSVPERQALWMAEIGQQAVDGLGRVLPAVWNPVSESRGR